MFHQPVPTSNRFPGIAGAILLVSSILMSPTPLRAQAVSEVAVVNVEEVLSSPLGQMATEQLEILAREFEAEIRPEGDRLGAAQTQFQEDIKNGVLNGDKRELRNDELRAWAAELTARANESRAELQELQRLLERKLIETLVLAAGGYAVENGYQLVIPTGEIIFGNSPPDITQAVIRRMETILNE